MRRLLAFLFALFHTVASPAQERHVTVQLDDGETIRGQVLAMDLSTLKVQVDGQVRTLESARIRSCRFEPAGPAATGAETTAAPAEAPQQPAAQQPSPNATAGTAAETPAATAATPPTPAPTTAPAGEAGGTEPADAGKVRTKRVTWQGPLPDPAETNGDLLITARPSIWRQRLQELTAAYPWLQPVGAVQWFSIGLLLVILASLTIHMSVNVAGAESATLGRGVMLATWYLLTTLLQCAMVKCNHLTVTLMLLVNPTFALLWLRALFGLTRGAATIAFAVQLGFAVLGYGVLELVTAILGSITPPAS